MAQYLSPGVYVEEPEVGPLPIEGVSTSVAGAVGVTVRGPTSGKPVLVTSFAEFQRNFGGFLPTQPDDLVTKWSQDPVEGGRWWLFPFAVKGFFDNGGQQLFVKRVFSSQAVAAQNTMLEGLTAEVESDSGPTDTTLQLRHLFGITNGTSILLRRGDDNTSVASFVVASYDPGTRTIDVGGPLNAAVKAARGDFVEITYNAKNRNASATKSLIFTAKALGDWGNQLSVRVRPTIGATLNLLYTTIGGSPASTTVKTNTPIVGTGAAIDLPVNDVTGFAANDVVQILGAKYTLGAFGPPGTIHLTLPTGVTLQNGAAVRRLRQANDPTNPTTRKLMSIAGADALYPGAILEFDNGTKKETSVVVSITGNTVTLKEEIGLAGIIYSENDKVRLAEADVTAQYTPTDGPAVTESFTGLRLNDDGTLNYLVTLINTRSNLVTVALDLGAVIDTNDLSDFPVADTPGFGLFMPLSAGTAGDDKLGDLSIVDFIGFDGGSNQRTGIQSFEDIDEISLCLAPGIWSQSVQGALIQHCELLRSRFAILDPQDELSIQGVRSFREPLDSKYAALYYPWVVVLDPTTAADVEVPPSGHVCGVYARVDETRGVWKAPGNEQLLSIVRIAQDVTSREQDLLNPIGINALRRFPDRGDRIWGARTLSSDSTWRYVSVRRFFIFLEESIKRGTQPFVFEPNDEPLWARVRQTITNFLTTQWRDGALQGTVPAEAFFVKCDRTTMTQDDIDNGRLICVIGVAPVKPAEFVIFRVEQKTLAATG
jgi:phage tail sheath protein FI